LIYLLTHFLIIFSILYGGGLQLSVDTCYYLFLFYLICYISTKSSLPSKKLQLPKKRLEKNNKMCLTWALFELIIIFTSKFYISRQNSYKYKNHSNLSVTGKTLWMDLFLYLTTFLRNSDEKRTHSVKQWSEILF